MDRVALCSIRSQRPMDHQQPSVSAFNPKKPFDIDRHFPELDRICAPGRSVPMRPTVTRLRKTVKSTEIVQRPARAAIGVPDSVTIELPHVARLRTTRVGMVFGVVFPPSNSGFSFPPLPVLVVRTRVRRSSDRQALPDVLRRRLVVFGRHCSRNCFCQFSLRLASTVGEVPVVDDTRAYSNTYRALSARQQIVAGKGA